MYFRQRAGSTSRRYSKYRPTSRRFSCLARSGVDANGLNKAGKGVRDCHYDHPYYLHEFGLEHPLKWPEPCWTLGQKEKKLQKTSKKNCSAEKKSLRLTSNYVSSYDYTLLYSSSALGHVEVVSTLVGCGADEIFLTVHHRSSLHAAVSHDSAEIARDRPKFFLMPKRMPTLLMRRYLLLIYNMAKSVSVIETLIAAGAGPGISSSSGGRRYIQMPSDRRLLCNI